MIYDIYIYSNMHVLHHCALFRNIKALLAVSIV